MQLNLFVNTPANWDILLNQHSLERNANELYTQNKSKLLAAKTIEIQGASFGGLNAFAFLAAISKDKTYGQTILNKITNIDLIDPLPNIGQSRIGKLQATGLWIAKTFTGNLGSAPSIRKYLQTIAQNGCTLPNADVMHYCANNDSMINHTEEYNTIMQNRFKATVYDKKIFKSYTNEEYAGEHVSKAIKVNPDRLQSVQENNDSRCNVVDILDDNTKVAAFNIMRNIPQMNVSNSMMKSENILDKNHFNENMR